MLNPADPQFLTGLAAQLPPDTLRAPEPRYLEEPRGRWHGVAGAVALPRSTDQVAAILRACAAARVGVVPWGGGTGLVGGQIMPDGPAPLLISLERMAARRSVHPDENVLVVEAGMTLAGVQAEAEAVGRLFPLSLASEGTCRIGGNLATNAGGLGVLRYGNARDLCLGVEAVLADGSIFNGLKRLRKDNTGYDLRHLLIGSEGTLGVITAAALRMVPVPAAFGTALLVVGGPAQALRLLRLVEDRLPGMMLRFVRLTNHAQVAIHLRERFPVRHFVDHFGDLFLLLGAQFIPPIQQPDLLQISHSGKFEHGVGKLHVAGRAVVRELQFRVAPLHEFAVRNDLLRAQERRAREERIRHLLVERAADLAIVIHDRDLQLVQLFGR